LRFEGLLFLFKTQHFLLTWQSLLQTI
jgi:hypothetical protein